MPVASLSEVLAYQNEDIVLRFMETWDVPRADADSLFHEMKKWLWLGATLTEKGGDVPDLAITPSMKLVDEMWHTFVLFSRSYIGFCDKYFGFYLHHDPTPQSVYDVQITAYERDPEVFRARQEEEFERQCGVIYDLLGEETLVRWYSEFLEKYTDEYMRKVWRWSFSPYDSRMREQVRLAPTPDEKKVSVAATG